MPVAERIAEQVICLPIYPDLSQQNMQLIEIICLLQKTFLN